MAKSPDAFRTISEVAAQLDTPAHVLRFWESKFPQIKPVKRAGGRRYYRPDDIALVAGIKVLLHDQGMTIRGVQKLLRERGAKHVATMSALPWEGVEETEDAPESLEGAAAEGTPDDGLPDPVVVGPWPRTGVEDSGAAKPEGQPEVPAPLPSQSVVPDTLVADVVALAPAPRETGSVRAGTSVAHLREAIGCADRARLRAEGVRLRPLVQRLRTLRDGTPGQPG